MGPGGGGLEQSCEWDCADGRGSCGCETQGYRTVPNSFHGTDLVTWLVSSGCCSTREQAVEVGEMLLKVTPLVGLWRPAGARRAFVYRELSLCTR